MLNPLPQDQDKTHYSGSESLCYTAEISSLIFVPVIKVARSSNRTWLLVTIEQFKWITPSSEKTNTDWQLLLQELSSARLQNLLKLCDAVGLRANVIAYPTDALGQPTRPTQPFILKGSINANHTTPAFTRSSPGGATAEWTVIAPADEAYYSFIDPVRMKGWVVSMQSHTHTHTGRRSRRWK